MKLSDVTLREADQMPGRAYTAAQKIKAGKQLDRLELPFIQAGFPVTGVKDKEVISELASSIDASVIALARAVPKDVEAAIEAKANVIEIFAPFSDLQLRHLIGKPREAMIESLSETVEQARVEGIPVHISLLDAFRTDPSVIIDVYDRFPHAEYITLADTIGAMTPPAVEDVLEEFATEIDLSRVGVHFHDDLGVATSNTMIAQRSGVGKADVSVASLGERAGNPALEEVVAIAELDERDDFGLNQELLVPVCNGTLEALGESISPRKSILGTEVYEHESGLHTTAMLDEPSLFEPFPPERFGARRRLLFGNGTGRSGAQKLLERAGIQSTEARVEKLLSLLSEYGPVETSEAILLAEETVRDPNLQ